VTESRQRVLFHQRIVDLEETLRALAPRLLRYCVGRSGDPDVAADVAQSALTALVSHWRRRGPPDSPEGFVFAIARRRVVRAVVRRRLLLPIELVLGRRNGSPSPEDVACDRSRLRQAIAALSQLSTRDREAVLLTLAGDLTMEGAAQVLGVTPSAVKMRVLRARQRLRELLEGTNGTGRSRSNR
jgi:RNA polymerase sigma-70 factor (ECF subfamily)